MPPFVLRPALSCPNHKKGRFRWNRPAEFGYLVVMNGLIDAFPLIFRRILGLDDISRANDLETGDRNIITG